MDFLSLIQLRSISDAYDRSLVEFGRFSLQVESPPIAGSNNRPSGSGAETQTSSPIVNRRGAAPSIRIGAATTHLSPILDRSGEAENSAASQAEEDGEERCSTR